MVLTDKPVAIVTGGASGIGAAITRRLLADGFAVAIGDLVPPEPGDRLLTAAEYRTLDVAEPQACDAFVDHVIERFGGIDLLVNDAGINHRAPLATTDIADWRRVFSVNVEGAFSMCRASHEALVARRGSVVFLGSTCGAVGIAGSAAYCASKAAVMHLARILAAEWAADGVRANCVAATAVRSAMTADVFEDPVYVRNKLASIPLGRFPDDTDVANAVSFLASREAANVTGQVLYVDGGVTAI